MSALHRYWFAWQYYRRLLHTECNCRDLSIGEMIYHHQHGRHPRQRYPVEASTPRGKFSFANSVDVFYVFPFPKFCLKSIPKVSRRRLIMTQPCVQELLPTISCIHRWYDLISPLTSIWSSSLTILRILWGASSLSQQQMNAPPQSSALWFGHTIALLFVIKIPITDKYLFSSERDFDFIGIHEAAVIIQGAR